MIEINYGGRVTEWMDAAAAAERLGVKTATLYAYVSRGVLRRRHSADGRRSLFDPAEVERLALRGRPRHRPGPTELVIESEITELGDGRPYYRGRDALALAASATFEDVARWLWTAETPGEQPWRATEAAVRAGMAAQAGLPAETLPLERLQVITSALAVVDPLSRSLDAGAVVETGRRLIAGMVDCLPGARTDTATGIAERVWQGLAGTGDSVDVVRAALVLLADHELAASTLAARVAASVRAGPYGVVSAGLGVLGGALHGGASLGVEALLAEVGEPGRAASVVAGRLRRGERIPGFGHQVYKTGDRRGTYLMDELRATGQPGVAVAEAVLDAARSHRLPLMNMDFALGTMATVTGMTRGAGEAVFAIARTAGWLAHALEEYEHGVPLRPRAVYTGSAHG